MENPELIKATLIRRYKRFLADVTLENGEQITAHVANPGTMTGLAEEGMTVWLSRSSNPKRKLPLSWELTELPSGALVSVNTGRTNKLAQEALETGHIKPLAGFAALKAEVPYAEKSRVDFLLTAADGGLTYVEVKSVSLSRQSGLAEFPDAKTARGVKHLQDLTQMIAQGHKAAMLFIAPRNDCDRFAIAADIDLAYNDALIAAQAAGVQMLAYGAKMTLKDMRVGEPLALELYFGRRR